MPDTLASWIAPKLGGPRDAPRVGEAGADSRGQQFDVALLWHVMLLPFIGHRCSPPVPLCGDVRSTVHHVRWVMFESVMLTAAVLAVHKMTMPGSSTDSASS